MSNDSEADVMAYERYLFPNNKTALVSLLNHVLGLRIMGHADGIGTHILNKVQIGVVLASL